MKFEEIKHILDELYSEVSMAELTNEEITFLTDMLNNLNKVLFKKLKDLDY